MVGNDQIAQRVEESRVALGLTQRDLAERSGISQATLSRSLNGSREFHVDELLDIAAALDIPFAGLIDDDPGDEGSLFAARTSCPDPATEAVRRRLATLLRIRRTLDDLT